MGFRQTNPTNSSNPIKKYNMPCSKCGTSGHNVRTCPINKAYILQTQQGSVATDELTALKKKLKKEKKRSRQRLRECRRLGERVELMTEEAGEQKKQLDEKDDTISKLRQGESEICNICFEPVAPGAENKTECGHTFHCGCLLKWLKTKNTCPCCRAELYEKPKTHVDDFDRVIGDAMVDLYSQEIVNDPEMEPLLEFGNLIITNLTQELDDMPTLETVSEYINEVYTGDEADSSDDDSSYVEEPLWVRLVGSEQDEGVFYVNQVTGEIRNENPGDIPIADVTPIDDEAEIFGFGTARSFIDLSESGTTLPTQVVSQGIRV
jgi:hypothetical protein